MHCHYLARLYIDWQPPEDDRGVAEYLGTALVTAGIGSPERGGRLGVGNLSPGEKGPLPLGHPWKVKLPRRIRGLAQEELPPARLDQGALEGHPGCSEFRFRLDQGVNGVSVAGLDPVQLAIELRGARHEKERHV